ncbi:MAG: hypothetical protein J7497_03460 [Chitinophagaceae bacterium]|nr:hypothetical protein [Chitinophagaceae bacterium]
MKKEVDKDALIQLLQAENKNFRLMVVDMRQLIKSLEEGIKWRDERLEEMRMITNELLRRNAS